MISTHTELVTGGSDRVGHAVAMLSIGGPGVADATLAGGPLDAPTWIPSGSAIASAFGDGALVSAELRGVWP